MTSAMQWLEDELRQTKVHLAKLQQQLEGLQSHIWRNREEFQQSQEELSGFRLQMTALSGLQAQLHEVSTLVAQLKEGQEAVREIVAGARNQFQTTAEKMHQEWNQMLRRLDTTEKTAATVEQRAASLEEHQRLLRTEATRLEQEMGQGLRDIDQAQTRAARNLEATKRLEQELERIDGDAQALHKQDDVLMERIRLSGEHNRQIEERLSVLISDQTTHDEILTKVELARTEGQHLGERLASLEKAMDSQRRLVDDQANGLSLVEAKLQGQVERLIELQRQLGGYHQDLLTSLRRWGQLQEKQRRRTLSSLEQELRELKQYDLKLSSE